MSPDEDKELISGTNCCAGPQAAKPKAASGCEKENNPARTPEALPEGKRAEYRLLKEEIAR